MAEVLVISQPDRPAGRGLRTRANPVVQRARDLGVAVDQPIKMRDPALAERWQGFWPDFVLTASYGRILPESLLQIPQIAALNVHPSPLPRWRGPAPIVWTLLAGDQQTALSVQTMVAEVDRGPIWYQEAVPIGPDETAGELTARLATLAAVRLPKLLERWLAAPPQTRDQDEAGATWAPLPEAGLRLLDFNLDAEELYRRVRAQTPEPGVFTYLGGEKVLVRRARPLSSLSGEPGAVLGVHGPSLAVACSQGGLLWLEVQPAGGKSMSGADYWRGRMARGLQRFGSPL